VIESGASLMEIVPSDSPLFVEAKLRLSDVSDVKSGQIADVRLSGVPRNIRPKIAGTVRSVSADSLSDQATGTGYYALQIELDREDIEKASVALQPGMPVQAIIETQPRTLAEYLAGPLIDEVTGAFRER
jgi:multidrug efflux pump subunit AcrA (membrane-fusion protein)